MTFIDRSGAVGEGDYPVFEKTLLSSTAADGPSAGATKRAWDNFAIAMSAAAVAAGTPPVNGGVGAPSWRRLARVGALKWVVLGAIGGGGLTALWMNARPIAGRSSTETSPSVVAVRPSIPTTFVGGEDPLDVRAQAAGADAHKGERISRRRWRIVAVRREDAADNRDPRGGEEIPPPARATGDSALGNRVSNLAAEVALIDAARSAISQGDFTNALRLVDRYREKFSNGELARDVDVVAIQALAGHGDRGGVILEGTRFLERHPNDPQVPRIKALVAH